jgi:hypothetical protein
VTDTLVAFLGALVKLPLPPAGDQIVDVVVDVLQGVDDLVAGARDGWGADDEDLLGVQITGALDAIPGVSRTRAERMGTGLAAGISLCIEAAPVKRARPLRDFFRKRARVR